MGIAVAQQVKQIQSACEWRSRHFNFNYRRGMHWFREETHRCPSARALAIRHAVNNEPRPRTRNLRPANHATAPKSINDCGVHREIKPRGRNIHTIVGATRNCRFGACSRWP